jgi:uncharacterized membrane protein
MTDANNELQKAVEAKVTEAVSSTDVDASITAVPPITQAVMDEITPRINTLTNQEPWWQSRVVLGSLLIVISRLVAHFGWSIPADLHGDVINLIIAFGPYIGVVLVVWGRYAKKPLMWLNGKK